MVKHSTKSSSESSKSSTRETKTLESLAKFYGVMGNMPDAPGALSYMATSLCAAATDEEIMIALGRCTHECVYPVRLPDIMKRLPGREVPQLEAEARKAWDVLVAFVKKYVSNDVYGNYGPEHGWYPKSFPQLHDRIIDTMRRTGGWKVYARMTEEDFPFQQKRFFEEYNAWQAVERISDAAHILETHAHPKYLLVGEPPVKVRIHEGNVPLPEPAVVHTMDTCAKLVKPIPEPKTDTEIRDRRVMLKQQLEQLTKR